MQAVAEAPELVGPQLTALVERVAMEQNSMVRTGLAVAGRWRWYLWTAAGPGGPGGNYGGGGGGGGNAFLTGPGVPAFRRTNRRHVYPGSFIFDLSNPLR